MIVPTHLSVFATGAEMSHGAIESCANSASKPRSALGADLRKVPDSFFGQRHTRVSLGQHLLKRGAVGIVLEQLQPTIGSIEHMLHIAAHQRPGTSGHARILSTVSPTEMTPASFTSVRTNFSELHVQLLSRISAPDPLTKVPTIMRAKNRLVALIAAILSLSAASCSVGLLPEPGSPVRSPVFQYRSQCLVDNELRILLETAIRYQPRTSASSKVSSAKGWLITVDLSKTGPIGERARVFGPLWDVPDERSSLNFDAGVKFTGRDAAASKATPFVDFDSRGTLVRIRPDPQNPAAPMIRERLVMAAHPVWQPDGTFLRLPPPGRPMNEDTLVTASGQYHLQLSGGKTFLHERLTGKQIPDPWLEEAFANLRGMKDFGNVKTWLTDDLKYLVSSPDPNWKDRTFEYNAKDYNRGEYGLVWQRPNPEAIIFKKPRTETNTTRIAIEGALSIDGRLYFLYRDGTTAWIDHTDQKAVATLMPFAEGSIYRIHAPREWHVEWGLLADRRPVQLLAKPNRLVFFCKNDFGSQHAPRRVPDEAMIVFEWNLRNGSLSVREAATGGLFDGQRAEYRPKQCTAIR
jgi:hypothetical protein